MIRISKHGAPRMLRPFLLSAMVCVGVMTSALAQNKPAPVPVKAAAPLKAAAPVTAPAPASASASAPTSASAPAPVEQPSTQILSDTLHYDDIKRENTFTGNVVMTRGLMTLNADTLILNEESDGSQFGVGTVKPGKRVFIRQERPENFEVLEGVGERADYNGRDEIFDLIGQAIVTRFICGQQFDTVSGEKVRYSQKTDTYEAFSGPNSANPNGRVRSVAQPRARADAAVAACRAKQAAVTSSKPTPVLTVPKTNPGKN